jgi:hypothetical protein
MLFKTTASGCICYLNLGLYFFSFYRKDATSQRFDFISFLFTAKTLRRKGLLLLFSFYRKDFSQFFVPLRLCG